MIVSLAGRRIDPIDAKVKRFPLENKELVRQRILELFIEEKESTNSFKDPEVCISIERFTFTFFCLASIDLFLTLNSSVSSMYLFDIKYSLNFSS